jgi:hypothetical protein
MVLANVGIENVHADVDDLIATEVLRRVLALTEVKFPSSLMKPAET